jgi:sugar lactone lactonase YvrE
MLSGSRSKFVSLSAALAFLPVLCQAQGFAAAAVAGGRAHIQHTPGEQEQPDIFGPGVLAVDSSGDVYVSARDGVFKVEGAKTYTRVAGTEREWRYSGDGGPALEARLNPSAVAVDTAGDLYLADSGNHRIRKLSAATGIITTVAGNGVKGFSGDGGPATGAQLDGPTGVAVDIAGNLYIADGTRDGQMRIRKVAAATGMITTVAGNGSQGYSGDGGPATSARFQSLGGLAVDAAGNLYIADNFNNRIRMVSAITGIVTTVAGNGATGQSGDGGPAANAQLNNPLAVAADAAGNLYIADSYNYRIRKVTAATGTIATLAEDSAALYGDGRHGFPCAVVVDASGRLNIADSGISRIRTIQAVAAARTTVADEVALPALRSRLLPAGFTINVTYGPGVPTAAQTAFNNVIAAYEKAFTTNITVNIDVDFGETGLGASLTQQVDEPYSSWRANMLANAAANPGNIWNVAAAASLPETDPIGDGTVIVNTPIARALGFRVNVAVDSTLTFSNSVTFEYTGVASAEAEDFMDIAAHELDEGLVVGSELTGLANNAALPTEFEAEDYFRYSAAPGTRDITTNPNAAVYFSYNAGATDVAQFNQEYSALGDSDLDRNDWIYGNAGCPAATPHIQDAIQCYGQAVAVGQAGSPEVIVLNSMGFNSTAALTSQTITFDPLPNVTYGVAPFVISATASSGLPVSFSTTGTVCSVVGSTVTINSAGTCSITASRSGNSEYSAAPPVIQSFTVDKAGQTISFGLLSDQTLGSTPPPLSATTTSGLAVTYVSNNASVCTATLTLMAAGVCSITATQPGNTDYLAATPVTQTFTVSASGIQPVAGFLDQNGAPALTFNGSTSFPDAGGFLIGAPGVTQDLYGNAYVVGLDSAGGVHLNSYSFAGSSWNGWQYSGGILDTSSGLTAAVAPSGVVWFTGRDIGNRFWINSWNGTSFGGWILVADGIFASDSIPQIAIPSDGTIYVVGKDTGGRIWSNSYNPMNQTFTGWVDRQAVMIGQPSVTAGQDGMVYVAVRSVSSNSPVYITQIPAQNAATANTWLNGGGQIDTDPQISSQDGTVYLLAEAGGNTVYLLTFTESNQMFGTWSFTNGILNDSTIAAAAGNVFIAGRDSADRIYWYSLTGNSWFVAGGGGISSTVLAGGK